jgi:ferritin-like metal-binding protein YciE
MAKEKELKDLFLDTLKDIYFAEKKDPISIAKNGQGGPIAEAQGRI